MGLEQRQLGDSIKNVASKNILALPLALELPP